MVWASGLVRLPIRKEQNFHGYIIAKCYQYLSFIVESGVSESFCKLQGLPPVILFFACYFKVNPFSRTTERSPMLDHWGPELSDDVLVPLFEALRRVVGLRVENRCLFPGM